MSKLSTECLNKEILEDVPAPHAAPAALRRRIERTVWGTFAASGSANFRGVLWRAAVILIAFVVGMVFSADTGLMSIHSSLRRLL